MNINPATATAQQQFLSARGDRVVLLPDKTEGRYGKYVPTKAVTKSGRMMPTAI